MGTETIDIVVSNRGINASYFACAGLEIVVVTPRGESNLSLRTWDEDDLCR